MPPPWATRGSTKSSKSTSKMDNSIQAFLEDEHISVGDTDAWAPSSTNSLILSVCYSDGRLGAALYDQSCTTVRLLRDVGEEYHFPVLASLLEQTNPTMVVANRGQDVNLINFLSKACGISVAEDDDIADSTYIDLNETGHSSSRLHDFSGPRSDESSRGESIKNRVLPSRTLSECGSNMIREAEEVEDEERGLEEDTPNTSLRRHSSFDRMSARQVKRVTEEDDLDEDEDDDGEEGQTLNATLHFMSGVSFNRDRALARINELFAAEALTECENDIITRFRIETSAVNMVRAFGALLVYVDSARTGVEFDLPNARTPITAIRTLLVQEMVEMDASTFRALDIFCENNGTDTVVRSAEHAKMIKKSRLSVFGLCCRCRSAAGKKMLRKWFERPTRDLAVLNMRHEAISFLIREDNMDVVAFLYRTLRPIRTLRTIVKRLKASNMRCMDWSALHATCVSLHQLGLLLRSGRFSLDIVRPFVPYFDDRLTEMHSVMAALIDYDESRVENRMVVKADVDPELDRMKAIYRSLPDRMTEAAMAETERLNAPSCAVGYVPMVGYLLQLPKNYNYDAVEDLVFIYADGEYIHVKSDVMHSMDVEIGDVKMQIIDRETTIMLRLERQLTARASLLLTCVRAAATVDCCMALAHAARMFGWTRPAMTEKAEIVASKVVHPLASLTVEKHFVPNSIVSGGDDGETKVKMFTGPNACGKSVYLKQVGILCYLAHVGSFVPAASAKIGLMNGILTRMYTVDGVLDGMSTFAKDLGQLSLALRRSTGNSLVIIDEFGKGTMTEVGLSLLTAAVEHLTNKGREDCPHLLVSTHFHALLDLLETDQEMITYQTFEVLRRGATLDFQYRLVDGVVNSSFASFTAIKMGISSHVVEKATKVYEHLRDGGFLSDVRVEDEEEERRNDFLLEKMENMQSWIEDWRLDDVPDFEDYEENDEGGQFADRERKVHPDVQSVLDELHRRLFTEVEKKSLDEGVEEEEDEEETVTVEKNDEEERTEQIEQAHEQSRVSFVDEKSEERPTMSAERKKDVEEDKIQCTFPWDNETSQQIMSQQFVRPMERKRVQATPAVSKSTTATTRSPLLFSQSDPFALLEQSQDLSSQSQSQRSEQRVSLFDVSQGEEEEIELFGDGPTDNKERDDNDHDTSSRAHERTLDVSYASTTADMSCGNNSSATRAAAGSILKGSREQRGDRSDRSNLSVSFSTAVTMMMAGNEQPLPVSPRRRGYPRLEELLGGGVSAPRVEPKKKVNETYDGDVETRILTVGVKRMRSH